VKALRFPVEVPRRFEKIDPAFRLKENKSNCRRIYTCFPVSPLAIIIFVFAQSANGEQKKGFFEIVSPQGTWVKFFCHLHISISYL